MQVFLNLNHQSRSSLEIIMPRGQVVIDVRSLCFSATLLMLSTRLPLNVSRSKEAALYTCGKGVKPERHHLPSSIIDIKQLCFRMKTCKAAEPACKNFFSILSSMIEFVYVTDADAIRYLMFIVPSVGDNINNMILAI
jgi:hypothetical protein